MTLEEAINHCEGKAEELERSVKLHQRPDRRIKGSGKRYLSCIECANEHRQLAEWLRELKAYREARNEITRKMNSGQWSEGVVYGLDKAVRIMEKHLREVNTDERR